ncbi:MAG: GHMP kinase [Anaerolineae bacterium]|nr:GHMP kinase [Phycisphaerae bacterium]
MAPAHELLSLEPVPTLLARTRAELSASFDFARPMRISRAPGRLDVMGGIADYTGSLVCEATLDRAAAVVLQERTPVDREIQIFSFNLFDEHVPFTFRMSIDALANATIELLRKEFAEPGRRWAGYIAGCLFVLHEQKLVDLRDPTIRGMNLALLSTVPLGAGVSSSAAIEVATMINLVDHLQIPRSDDRQIVDASRGSSIDAMRLATLCQRVENQVVGAPSGIMDQVTSCVGEEGALLRLLCQPHELQPQLKLPENIRAIGINSNVKHSVGGGQYGITRCAAFMAHRMILEKMREMGSAAKRELASDPMRGYLANLDQDDYKKFFRQYLPEWMTGKDFLSRFDGTIDTATRVDLAVNYPVQHAADHHVLEARRVRDFVALIEQAALAPPGTREQGRPLDMAGHLMYASHLSYTNDAMLGAPECDTLVQLVKHHEPAGLYGAKITGGGSGGTVAVLCDRSEKADVAIAKIMTEYEQQTGRKPEAFTGSSPGAWVVGTKLASLKSASPD